MTDTGDIVVRTFGLTKTFDGVQAVKSIDLTVRRNSIFGFLGPNGAGKTTTMKMLLGLLYPTAGRGEVFGLDIVSGSTEIRARVGYLPQEPRFYEHMTARETLAFTASFFYSGSRAAIADRVDEMIELVGLQGKADRPVKGFSGGERQRLGIAQAQVNHPDLLILDEPAASLDPLGRRDVLTILERLRETATVIYSTHILDDVQRVSDTVAIVNHGELVAFGPIEQLLAGGSDATAYVLALRGDSASARTALGALPWVADIAESSAEDRTVLIVAVSDPEAAERELLRAVLANDAVTILEFKKRSAALEDVFLDIVEGGSHVSR